MDSNTTDHNRRSGAGGVGRAGAIPGSTLADLYDPVSMPPKLAKAHEQLAAPLIAMKKSVRQLKPKPADATQGGTGAA